MDFIHVTDEHDNFSDFETDGFDLPIDLKTVYLFTLIKKYLFIYVYQYYRFVKMSEFRKEKENVAFYQ